MTPTRAINRNILLSLLTTRTSESIYPHITVFLNTHAPRVPHDSDIPLPLLGLPLSCETLIYPELTCPVYSLSIPHKIFMEIVMNEGKETNKIT